MKAGAVEEHDEGKAHDMRNVCKSKAAFQKIKYDIEKLMLQAMFDTMGVAQMGQILQIMQKHERATSQWPSESALEEGEAPIPARKA